MELYRRHHHRHELSSSLFIVLVQFCCVRALIVRSVSRSETSNLHYTFLSGPKLVRQIESVSWRHRERETQRETRKHKRLCFVLHYAQIYLYIYSASVLFNYSNYSGWRSHSGDSGAAAAAAAIRMRHVRRSLNLLSLCAFTKVGATHCYYLARTKKKKQFWCERQLHAHE